MNVGKPCLTAWEEAHGPKFFGHFEKRGGNRFHVESIGEKVKRARDFFILPSFSRACKWACSSSNLANSSGEYSFVENKVTNIDPTKIAAPIIKESTR